MSKLTILSKDDNLYIKGNYNSLLGKRNLHHLNRIFGAEVTEDYILIQGFSKDEKIISRLSDFFQKKSIEFQLDNTSNVIINKLYQEEENFKSFSLKAKKIWNNEVNLDEFNNFKDVLLSKMIRRLYPLQMLSSFHLAYSQNSCNFSVPGAGKTSIVYGAYTYLKSLDERNEKHVNKILVIGPLSSFGPWETEFKECFSKKVNSKRLSGGNVDGKTKKDYFFSRNTSELTLISYQGVLSQKENIEYFLKNNNVMVILDEAHKIKNTNGGQIAETILDIAPFCKCRVVLTGTPAPNGYRDLYNLFKFIWPKKDIIRFSPIQLEDMTKSHRDNRVNILIDNLSPYFVRIKKSDLNLPIKHENPPILIEMDETQRYIYDAIEKKYIDYFIKEDTIEDNSFLSKIKKAKLIRLIQAASNPKLLNKPIIDEYGNDYQINDLDLNDQTFINAISSYVERNAVPRKFLKAYELLIEHINKGEKIIVWAIFIETILEFEKFLISRGVNCKKLYGKTPIESDNAYEQFETRESIIRDFHCEDSDFKVIIANPFAVAESISLHKACHNAIYLERNFDAARYVQSKDRIHRYGIDKDVETNYYYLMSNNSIDETINNKLQDKEELMLKVTESQEIPLFTNLEDDNENDIRALINDYVNRP